MEKSKALLLSAGRGALLGGLTVFFWTSGTFVARHLGSSTREDVLALGLTSFVFGFSITPARLAELLTEQASVRRPRWAAAFAWLATIVLGLGLFLQASYTFHALEEHSVASAFRATGRYARNVVGAPAESVIVLATLAAPFGALVIARLQAKGIAWQTVRTLLVTIPVTVPLVVIGFLLRYSGHELITAFMIALGLAISLPLASAVSDSVEGWIASRLPKREA